VSETQNPVVRTPGGNRLKGFEYVPVTEISEKAELQPRKHMTADYLDQLEMMIKNQGILAPLTVTKGEEKGSYCLVDGHRRLTVAKKIGLKVVPVVIIDENDPEKVAITTNLFREGFTPVDEAEALQRLFEKLEAEVDEVKDQKSFAEFVKMKESTLSEKLSLNKLHDAIKVECRTSHEYALRKLKQIAKIKDEQKQLEKFNVYKRAVQLKLAPPSEEDGNKTKRKNFSSEIKRKWFKTATDSLKSMVEKMEEKHLLAIKGDVQALIAAAKSLSKKIGKLEAASVKATEGTPAPTQEAPVVVVNAPAGAQPKETSGQ